MHLYMPCMFIFIFLMIMEARPQNPPAEGIRWEDFTHKYHHQHVMRSQKLVISLNPKLWSENTGPHFNLAYKFQHHSSLKERSFTFFSNAHCLLTIGGPIIFSPCLRHGSTLTPLCHSGRKAVCEVKSEKEKIPCSLSKEKFMEPSSLLLITTWTWYPSFWDLPSTSPTIYSTIPILPRPIKSGSYPMFEGDKSYVVALIF